MSAHRFKFEIGGETLHGLAFGSEDELEAFLCGRGLEIESQDNARSRQTPESDPRPPGRPSFDALLDELVARLTPEIDRCEKLTDAARLVQRALAVDLDASLIPSLKTISRFIEKQRLRQNCGQNSGQKPTVQR